MALDKASILSLTLPIKPFPVPQWGGDVHLRILTGEERFAWTRDVAEHKGEGDGRTVLSLLVRCLCDESGARLFSDSEEDIAALGKTHGGAIDLLGREALRMNGLSDEGREDIKKN